MIAIARAIERISDTVGLVGAWVMAPLVVSMVYEVLARHFFGAPTFWAYEVGYMLAGTTYMFGMAYCLRMGGHIRVDFIYEGLAPRRKALVNLLGYLILMLPVGLWVTWGLFHYAVEAYDANEVSGESAWNPIIWPFRAVWTIGFAALCLQAIAEVIKSALVLRGVNIAEHGFIGIEEPNT